jgi:anti-anti-sigma regulatory factor
MSHEIVESLVSAGIFDGFTWIRCEGKGSFRSSPVLKRFGESRVGAGEKTLVVDLDGCTGMDSTFMGTLAGLANLLAKKGSGVLQVVGTDERNRRSLEDLGLDLLVDIEPEQAVWRGRIDEVRKGLAPVDGGEFPGNNEDRARHVFEAHKTLADTSEENKKRFRGVLEVLEDELEKNKES